MSVGFTHLALHVRDLDACIDFYSEYCGMRIVHERSSNDKRIVWIAEPGRERELIFVLMPGGPGHEQAGTDYGHIGFAVESREAVDLIATRARRENRLAWEQVDEPYPVGYYCGVRDPDGKIVEFSYGQPLGKGAEAITETHSGE